MIPNLTKAGLLPAGIHNSTWDEFGNRFARNAHRKKLLMGLIEAAKVLKRAGCVLIYVDGSFVTDTELPNDYDACWDIYGVNPAALDPIMIQFDDTSRNLLKLKYLGDLFPAQLKEVSGKAFIDFFQTHRETGILKGIVALKPQAL